MLGMVTTPNHLLDCWQSQGLKQLGEPNRDPDKVKTGGCWEPTAVSWMLETVEAGGCCCLDDSVDSLKASAAEPGVHWDTTWDEPVTWGREPNQVEEDEIAREWSWGEGQVDRGRHEDDWMSDRDRATSNWPANDVPGQLSPNKGKPHDPCIHNIYRVETSGLIDWLYQSFPAHQHQKGHTVPKQLSPLDDGDDITESTSKKCYGSTVRELHCLRTTLWEHLLSGQVWTKCPTRPDTQGVPQGGCSLQPWGHLDQGCRSQRHNLIARHYWLRNRCWKHWEWGSWLRMFLQRLALEQRWSWETEYSVQEPLRRLIGLVLTLPSHIPLTHLGSVS